MSSSRPSPTRISAVPPGSTSLLTPSELSGSREAPRSGNFASVTQTPFAAPPSGSSEKYGNSSATAASPETISVSE